MISDSTRRRWGKAGRQLTAQEAAALARRKHQRAADQQETYRAWRAGRVTPWRIAAALDIRDLYGPEVDEACGVAEPAVDMWEDGRLYPTWQQLHNLAELTGFPARFFVLGGEPLRVEATSLLCGLTEKQLAEWKRDHREPVLEALPDAIAAATEGAPVEPPRIEPAPHRPQSPPREPTVTRDKPRRDRTGDIATEPVHHCANGWLPGHTLDDDQPRRCTICHPEFLPENRRRRLWGGNPDARPRPDLSSRNTSPTTRENR